MVSLAGGRGPADDLVPVADRIRWMQLSRSAMLVALPLLGMATRAPAGTARTLALVSAAWMAATLLTWPLVRLGRFAAMATLTLSLLGDGVILAWAWHRLDALDGPAGLLMVLHTMAVTLVASFRTGAKLALWHSLLALTVLEAVAAGLAGPVEPVPVWDLGVHLAALWAAALTTACLAAANERELRRRRHDERVLRELALSVGQEDDPACVAARLAAFGHAELRARRAAVVLLTDEPGARPGAAVAEDGRQVRTVPLSGVDRPLTFEPDTVRLLHIPDPVHDAWLCEALPGARDLVVVSFAVHHARGALVLEQRPRRSERRTRRVERRLIATARQAAALSAVAAGRAVAAARLAATANTDGLTGLANRRHFDTLLARRTAGSEPFALIMVDLDHFKALNDTYGHQAGDATLRAVAAALRGAAGDGDVVARYGGEELVALAALAPEQIESLAERLRLAVQHADTPVPVTASLGVACFPTEGTAAHRLIELADRRLYQAKRGGRNQVVATDAPAMQPTRRGLAAADDAADGPATEATHREL